MSKKKKKIRVEFRKNREKRSRKNNLTRQVNEAGGDADDHIGEERMSGKGELSRYRTVIGTEGEDGEEILLDVDESKCLNGLVISAIGLNSLVEDEQGNRYECTTRRVVRTIAREKRSAVVTGDHVLFQPTDHEFGVIERVNPRHGTLSRSSANREHIIVANVDQALVVVSANDPPLKPGLIDRFLISAEKGGVHSIICINKADLANKAELQPIMGLYSQLGYDVLLVSATENTGIDYLRTLMKDRQTVVSGQSGVGKSSLLNAIQSDLKLETGEVSEFHHKGKHTTRRAELLKLDFGGWVVDTPGIRQLALWDVIPEEVEGYFVEFRAFVPDCKFPDCSHTHENPCGIKKAVESGAISDLRYQSYLRIVNGDPD